MVNGLTVLINGQVLITQTVYSLYLLSREPAPGQQSYVHFMSNTALKDVFLGCFIIIIFSNYKSRNVGFVNGLPFQYSF